MSIEPLGSIMTYQAQNSSAQAVPAPAESKDATAQESGAMLDQTTAGVANIQETATDSESGSNGQNGNAKESLADGQQAQLEEATQERIKKAVEEFNKKSNSEAVFGIHEGTNRVTIKIVDKENKKVIKELPPEKTLDMIARVWEMAGILVDEKR